MHHCVYALFNTQKLPPELQVVTAFPEVRIHTRQQHSQRSNSSSSSSSSSAPDEYLLLACDGLWDVFTTQDAGETFWRQLQAVTLGSTPTGEDLAAACDAMVAEALARKSEDNITVMAVRLASGRSGSSSSASGSSGQTLFGTDSGLVPPGFSLSRASPDE
jgi:serine/threonine protein phosphatase PrpC